MTTRSPSWQHVANVLAARMAHHAYCAAHRPAEADVDNCPFCRDRAAYRLWQRKSQHQPAESLSAQAVHLRDLITTWPGRTDSPEEQR